MRRVRIPIFLWTTLIGVGFVVSPHLLSHFLPSPSASAAAQPPDTEDLPLLVASPTVITDAESTFVTFSAPLPDDVRGPKLQAYLPNETKWHILGSLKDDGKSSDLHAKDGEFSLRLRFDDSSSVVSIYSVNRGKAHLLSRTQSPVHLRLAAKRLRQRGLHVSPSLDLTAASPSAVIVDSGNGTAPISLMVPPTITIIRGAGSARLTLSRNTIDGYDIDVETYAKAANVSLESWVAQAGILPTLQLLTPATTTVGGLFALRYDVTTEAGSGPTFLVDDPANARVIAIDASATNLSDPSLFSSNLPEVLTLVESLHVE